MVKIMKNTKNKVQSDWKIIKYSDGAILLRSPEKYSKVSLWNKWGELQIEVLKKIHKFFENTYMYAYFLTYVPEQFRSLFRSILNDNFEEIPSGKKKSRIFLLPDIDDQEILKKMLTGYAVGCVLFLDKKPSQWQDFLIDSFKIIDKGQINNYEIDSCRSVIYFNDRDLTLVKEDIPFSEIFLFLEEIAKEEGLKLSIKEKTK
jgi:hypothetical protein